MESVFGNFRHEYEVRMLNGHRVVIDHATGLMWQPESVRLKGNRKSSIDEFNKTQYAGFADWRLPTIEELASLIESRAVRFKDVYRFVETVFDYFDCISADDVVVNGTGNALGIDFDEGGIVARWDETIPVCAVRSLKAGELRTRPALPQDAK
jgi:hypothetical protein